MSNRLVPVAPSASSQSRPAEKRPRSSPLASAPRARLVSQPRACPHTSGISLSAMAQRIIVYWRDIPAQVIVRQGRTSEKRELPERFIQAIDRAAMRAGLRDIRRLPGANGGAARRTVRRRPGRRGRCGTRRAGAGATIDGAGWTRWCRRTDEAVAVAPVTPMAGAKDARAVHAERPARTVRRSARRCSTRRARSASTSRAVCGGRGLCGRCQVEVAEGDVRQARHHQPRRAPLTAPGETDAPLSPSRRAAGAAAVLRRRACSATSSSTCRPSSRSTARWCASAPRPARIAADPATRLVTVSAARRRTWSARWATPTG